MKSRIFSFFLVLILCFSLVACSTQPEQTVAPTTVESVQTTTAVPTETTDVLETEAPTVQTEPQPMATQPQESQSNPLLYKVTDDSGNVIWLFGSIHVGRADFYPLPDYVMDAFAGSDALAVEADIVAFESDIVKQIALLQKMVYTDGTTVKDHIPEPLYQQAVALLTDAGMYSSLLDMYNAGLWYNFVESCTTMEAGLDVETGIDRMLIYAATDAGKEILEVESAEFQLGMLRDFSDELQIWLLEMAIEESKDLDLLRQTVDQMQDLWESGDEAAFSAYLSELPEFENAQQAKLYEEYNNALLVDRNNSMTLYAEEALKSGKEVFICVGAAHVVGEGAMAQQLQELGYTVELVR